LQPADNRKSRKRTFNAKGVIIFSVLGPPLGLMTALLVLIPLISLIASGKLEWTADPLGLVVLLPLSYFLGFVPAAVVGFVDALLARNAVPGRIAWTTLAGFFGTFLPVLSAITAGYIHGFSFLIGGIVGAVPAALCSWLASKTDPR
jgi:hypothetical protein